MSQLTHPRRPRGSKSERAKCLENFRRTISPAPDGLHLFRRSLFSFSFVFRSLEQMKKMRLSSLFDTETQYLIKRCAKEERPLDSSNSAITTTRFDFLRRPRSQGLSSRSLGRKEERLWERGCKMTRRQKSEKASSYSL